MSILGSTPCFKAYFDALPRHACSAAKHCMPVHHSNITTSFCRGQFRITRPTYPLNQLAAVCIAAESAKCLTRRLGILRRSDSLLPSTSTCTPAVCDAAETAMRLRDRVLADRAGCFRRPVARVWALHKPEPCCGPGLLLDRPAHSPLRIQ